MKQKTKPKKAKQKELFTKKVVERKVKKADPFDALFARWKAGEQIMALAAESSIKRSKLRRNLIRLAGGKEQFRALRSEGAGGTTEPFGGKRSVGRTRETIQHDDAKVKRISKPKERRKYKLETIWRPVVVPIDVHGERKHMAWREEVARLFVAPDGTKYVQANASEKADLIIEFPDLLGIPSTRLRRYETSAAAKRAKHEEKQIERGLKSIQKTRETKRAKRAERKARKHK